MEVLSQGEMAPFEPQKKLPQPEQQKWWLSENQRAKSQRGRWAPAEHLLTPLTVRSSPLSPSDCPDPRKPLLVGL